MDYGNEYVNPDMPDEDDEELDFEPAFGNQEDNEEEAQEMDFDFNMDEVVGDEDDTADETASDFGLNDLEDGSEDEDIDDSFFGSTGFEDSDEPGVKEMVFGNDSDDDDDDTLGAIELDDDEESEDDEDIGDYGQMEETSIATSEEDTSYEIESSDNEDETSEDESGDFDGYGFNDENSEDAVADVNNDSGETLATDEDDDSTYADLNDFLDATPREPNKFDVSFQSETEGMGYIEDETNGTELKFDDETVETVDEGIAVDDEGLPTISFEGASEQLLNTSDGSEIYDDRDGLIDAAGNIVVMSTHGDAFTFEYLDIECIVTGSRIRSHINVEDISKSIRSTGLLEPFMVAPTDTDGIYALVSGLRRLIACAKCGVKRIPCIINHNIKTTELHIVEAMYNHNKPYTVKEMVDYIEYLEKERNINNPSTIEYLLCMESGDYTKLKDILNDNDDDIVSQMMNGQLSIAQAFRKLETRRRKESRDEKDTKKAAKVFGDTTESGMEGLDATGVMGEDGLALSEDDIRNLGLTPRDIDTDNMSLEELLADGDTVKGFEPKVQTVGERELVDPAMRKAVMERDHNTCQCCGLGGPSYVDTMDFHHILPVFLGGPDSIDNAEAECLVCHKLIHLHARGQLFIPDLDNLDEGEREKFKKVLARGNYIRRGMETKGMKLDEYKKQDGIQQIGRQMPGQKNKIT